MVKNVSVVTNFPKVNWKTLGRNKPHSVLQIINEKYISFQRDHLEVIMELLDTLRRLTDRCFNFDNDEESLLEGFRRINPKPEDFLPPHDPVVAACLGKLD